jgi:hypothetical protein
VWGEQLAVRMLAAGFSNVAVRRVDGDFIYNYYIGKAG